MRPVNLEQYGMWWHGHKKFQDAYAEMVEALAKEDISVGMLKNLKFSYTIREPGPGYPEGFTALKITWGGKLL